MFEVVKVVFDLSPVVWGHGSMVCPAPFSPCLALLQESPLRTSCSTPQSSEKPHGNSSGEPQTDLKVQISTSPTAELPFLSFL